MILAKGSVLITMGVILWGLGVSLGFPLSLSVAGKSGTNPDERVAFASTVGYLAFLVGPPTIGLLGEAFELRRALIVVLCPLLLVVLVRSTAFVLRNSGDGLEPRERRGGSTG